MLHYFDSMYGFKKISIYRKKNAIYVTSSAINFICRNKNTINKQCNKNYENFNRCE